MKKYLQNVLMLGVMSFFLIIVFSACFKSKEEQETVTGQILYRSDSTPIANTYYYIGAKRYAFATGSDPAEVPFMTDSSGNFSVKFISKRGFASFLGQAGAGMVMYLKPDTTLPQGNNIINMGKVYLGH